MKHPLLFGIHCHQPIDNFSVVVDNAVVKSYRPFLEAALGFPKFKFSIHYSGWLLEYIKANHADTFKMMKQLAANGQVEFFTGGYYEPVLSAIPSDDRKGQVEQLSAFIKKNFGQTPRGLWLTERVWDPAVIPDMADIGLEYVIVDDYHFINAGFHPSSLHGYFLTEQDGKRMKLFPIDKNLRYITPFKPEEDVHTYLANVRAEGGKCSTIFDDGEKFGIWPKTWEWVYEKGWLKRWLTVMTESDEVEFALYSEVADSVKPNGIAYLPITSYAEMGEWSLFADAYNRFEKLRDFLKKTEFAEDAPGFVKGSIWKNYFVKYPESNRLHKRIQYLSTISTKQKKDAAFRQALYRSECNDCLWHGIFGGLYLPHLRNNAWRFLIEAEERYEELTGISYPHATLTDIDFDGYDDALIRTATYNAVFTGRDGGQLTCLDLKGKRFNLQNTLARHKEGYHEMLLNPKETSEDTTGISTIHDTVLTVTDDVKKHLVFDWYNRNSFIDHIVTAFSPEEFDKVTFRELSDLVNQPGTLTAEGAEVTFTRDGGLWHEGHSSPVSITKKYTCTPEGIAFDITLQSTHPKQLTYVLEWNFHAVEFERVLVNGSPLEEPSSFAGDRIIFVDDVLGSAVDISLGVHTSLGGFAVKTVSQSEEGAELSTQGIALFAAFPFTGTLNVKGIMRLMQREEG